MSVEVRSPNRTWGQRAITFCILLLCSFTSVSAATGGSLRGFVTDSSNGEAISYANLLIAGTSIGCNSNTRGYYYIPSIPEGPQIFVASCVGYKTLRIAVTIIEGSITQVNIKLFPTNLDVEETLVLGERSARKNETDLGLQRISVKEIEMVPAGFETDVFRVLQTNPGVNVTGDVTSKYYVRGGGGDQNLVLLNGATIYNPFHALGVFGVVDPEIINVAEFYKGGFLPQYGGRLSSILNIVTKDGNKNEFHAKAHAGLLSGKVAVEGPIPDGSFYVTGRKSYYGDILKKYLSRDNAPFNFYDIYFKVNYANPSIDNNGKFVAFGFFSHDDITNNDPLKENYTVGNTVVGINWHKVWSSPLFSIMNFSYSGFNAELFPNLSNAKARRNAVSDITNNWDFTYVYNSRDELAFGTQNKFLNTDVEMDNLFGNKTVLHQYGWDFNAYADYRYLRWEYFGLTVGMRIKFSSLSKYRPLLFEPRISTTYRPHPVIAFKAAIGWYSQEVLTLTDESELISIFEPWVITPDRVSSPQAAHYIFGISTFLSDRATFEIETYYKPTIDLIEVNTKKSTSLDRDYINVTGQSYGFECLLKYQPSSILLQGSYSLSWSYKQKNGLTYYPRYDVRHSINTLIGIEFWEGWQASATWFFKTGMPFTPIAGYYDRVIVEPSPTKRWYENIIPVVIWGETNSQRLPYYHRLDISITKKLQIDLLDLTVGLSFINVYDHKNIFYLDKNTGERIYMLPFSPSFSIEAAI